MKKSVSLMMILTLIATTCMISCKKSSTTTPPSSQILGKWTMKEAIGIYTVDGVNEKDTTAFTAADYIDFHADSTLTIVADGGTYNGKWQITDNKLLITGTNYMDYKKGMDFPILTTTNLQLYYTESNSFSTLEQKLNLVR